jgi:predicted dehydrogenase/threonine dehydrogenase-like Zn-dependent dehydrogenase
MKQVIQSFKTGELFVADVPAPILRPRGILVRTGASLVSAGTERMVVEWAEKNLLAKARARPDLVRQVISKAKREGLLATLDAMHGRLGTPLALGYSCAGTVVEVGNEARGFKIGDRVACAGGGYACHAEVVFVPKNLVVKVPENVSTQEAAFTTLGAIAVQGVRIADLKLGENVAIIGLGLVGQLTAQLVKATGCNVLGIDLDPDRVKLACELGADIGVVRGRDDVVTMAQEFSKGYGVDVVIITAATTSNDPVEMAGELSREKGRVVVVGAVGMNIPRKVYYEKELDLRLSRSYGPGRYDPEYEEKGHDYPYGYVRWTEKRNMEAFLILLAQGKVNVKKLITHRFSIEEAKKAYDLITGKSQEKYLGILLTYGGEVDLSRKIYIQKREMARQELKGKVSIGLIGAGNFAKAVLLPNLRKVPSVYFKGVATATGLSAKHAGEKYGFEYCTSDYHEILDDPEITAVFIVTRHNLHAPLVIEALNRGKAVYVEKPLALNEAELKQMIEAYQTLSPETLLMVGFNRRFAPFTQEAKRFFANRAGPLVVNYRINAGFIPKESWVHDPEEGGGRIVGEVCHFVDFIQYITGSAPVKVYAEAIPRQDKSALTSDTVCVNLKFKDGSMGTINYLANGDKALPKERIEIFGDNSIFIIDNFRSIEWVRRGKRKRRKSWLRQDKGHLGELQAFVEAIKDGKPSPIDFQEAVMTTLTTFKIVESIARGVPIEIDLSEVV